MSELSIFGFPVVETDAVAEGEVLFGSFPPPERDNMTLKEYAEQSAKHFTKIKLKKVDCWLCGGTSTATCNCHNHPPGKPAAPCNMTCRN